jgi:hypothetical protein
MSKAVFLYRQRMFIPLDPTNQSNQSPEILLTLSSNWLKSRGDRRQCEGYEVIDTSASDTSRSFYMLSPK